MIVHLLGIIILIIFIKLWLNLTRKRFYQRLPGCKDNGHWFFGNVVTLKTLSPKEIVEKFPKFYRYSRGLFQYRIACYHPELIAKVLENSERLPNDMTFGDSAFKRLPVQQSTGKQWKRYRNILHHSYGIETSNSLTNLCQEVYTSFIDEYRVMDVEKVDVNNLLNMMFECSNRIWFGNEINKSERRYIDKLNRIYKDFCEVRQDHKIKERGGTNALSLIFNYLKITIQFISLKKEFHIAHNTILKMRQQRAKSDTTGDLNGVLNWLILTERKGQYQLTDDDYTALFKSHHSVVMIVGEIFKKIILQLALHPEWQIKIREEIVHIKEKQSCLFEEIQYRDTKYIQWFILEVLRHQIQSPLPRSLTEPLKYDGYEFPKGTVMDINLWILHNHPDIWENADKFQPERFSENEKLEIYQYLPFSAMDRICPGKNLSLSVITGFVVTFLQRVKFEQRINGQLSLDQVYMSLISG